MDNAVFWRDCWLIQIQVAELDGVADAESLGCGIYNLVASLVVEGQADAEPVTGVKVP